MTVSFNINRERAVAVVLMGFFTLYLSQMRHLPTPIIDGADAGPALYGIALVLASYACLLHVAINSEDEVAIEVDRVKLGQIVGFIVISLVYVYLLFLIGFFIASLVYALGVIVIFERAEINKRRAIGVSILIMVTIFVLFTFVFNIRLPMGEFL